MHKGLVQWSGWSALYPFFSPVLTDCPSTHIYTVEKSSKQHYSSFGIKNGEKKHVLKGWVVQDGAQGWYVTYLSAGA